MKKDYVQVASLPMWLCIMLILAVFMLEHVFGHWFFGTSCVAH